MTETAHDVSSKSNAKIIAILVVSAFLLISPSLWLGLQLDDYFHWGLINNKHEVLALGTPGSLFGLFSFLDGNPQRVLDLADLGLVPWWTLPEIKYAFWRPLTELTHWVDYQFWPRWPVLMHLHSGVYYLLLLLISFRLYRRFQPGHKAWLWASWFLALSYVNGVPVAWLANRNAVLATLFLVLALGFHHQWRSNAQLKSFWLALLCFILGLFSGELAVSTGAYLLAYALFLDEGRIRQRFNSLVPYMLVGLSWLVVRNQLGYGASGSDHYLDPLNQPLLFIQSMAVRFFDLFSGLFWIVPPELATSLPPQRTLIYLVLAAGLLALIWPLLQKDKYARFWLAAACLSLVPIAATLPHSRLLLAANIGVCALLGLLVTIKHHPLVVLGGLRRQAFRIFIPVVLFLHLFISGLLLPVEAFSMKWIGDQLVNKGALSESLELAPLEEGTLVLINPPLSSAAGYVNGVRSYYGRPLPKQTWLLASGLEPLVLTVTSPVTIEISSERGLFQSEQEGVLRSSLVPFSIGDVVNLKGLAITVLAVNNGIPTKAEYRFKHSIYDYGGYYFYHWVGTQVKPCELPPINQAIELTLKSEQCYSVRSE